MQLEEKSLGHRFLATLALAIALAANSWPVFSASLADAVEKQDQAAIRALLQDKSEIHAAQPDGMTALHWAVYQDDLETAKRLLAAGADAKATNRYGVPPLSLACLNANSALVKLLLEAGADPNTTLRGGETALMTAARAGRLEPVKLLLARGADVNAKERRGQTPLMWAAAEGHAEVVRVLMEAGADYKSPLDSGFTPFLFAVREGKMNVAKLLLKSGVDVNEAMQARKVPGRGARSGTTPLIVAVENGHFELAVVLLEAGADPNDQRSGFTPLHMISWVRKPNRGDGEDGDPPPIGSGNLSSLQFVRKLVEHGADVNARLVKGKSGRGQLSRVGATPFLLASVTADVPLMKLLVELGADPNIPNADGATPLMAAAGLGTLAPTEEAGTEEEALEAAQLVLSLGNDVNAVDKNGETAMHGAAYKSFPRMVQFLTDKGASINIWNHKNKWNWTPLRIAEGYRVGNFKPSAETIAALHKVMLAAGITPPVSEPPAPGEYGPDYSNAEAPRKPAPALAPPQPAARN